MADTGLTVWAPGFWADDVWAAGLWSSQSPVTVPDVVGQTQAAGTATLQGLGFVVAVITAPSSLYPAGTISAQSPAAGASANYGSTVTITVSTGDSQASGGWWPDYEYHARQRRKKREEQQEREAETERIQEELTRDIARLLREQEARDAEKADLERLQKLADQYSGQKLGLPRQVSAALINAQEARTRNSLQQLQREVDQMLEQEELAITAAILLLLD